MKPTLLVIVGPTASGKTSTSITLAKMYQGEIISGDSMQVYRGMDIGTAKVTSEEMKGVPHHLIDICDPDESFTVHDFQQLALEKIEKIQQQSHLPIMVGGTGLYIESVTHGYQLPETEENHSLRLELESLAKQQGNAVLHQRLQELDPVSANRIHPNNLRRVIRALEVIEQTGKPFSEQSRNKQPRFKHTRWIGLTMPRDLLYERINHRVDLMMEQGLLDEVQNLKSRGFHTGMTAIQAIGYKELFQVLEGQLTLLAAVEKIKQGSRKYAKRQLSWFRRNKQIQWFDSSDQNVNQKIQQWLAEI